MSDGVILRHCPTGDLHDDQIAATRAMLIEAFGPDEDEAFTDADWLHAIGGEHFLAEIDGRIVTHASVIERSIQIGDRALRTGYVEAVATAVGQQGRGHGTTVMHAVGAWIREHYEIGALGTGRHTFYERLGWLTWLGPAFVRTTQGAIRTPDDEGYIMVLPIPASPSLDRSLAISCQWRPGDVW